MIKIVRMQLEMMIIYRVCLDPGHGGRDRYNRGAAGYVEADGVLDIALQTKKILREDKKIEVLLTREKDLTLVPRQRVALINSFQADILVSIHTNAAGQGVKGTETYHSIYSRPGRGGHRLAKLLQNEIVIACGTYDRGIKTRRGCHGDYYYIIRETYPSAVLTEIAFHSNQKEEQLLLTNKFRFQAAWGIATGIKKYFQ